MASSSTFVVKHGLSIILFCLWKLLTWLSYFTKPSSEPLSDWLSAIFANMAGDAFGALLIVLATKYFYEIGSAESKKPNEGEVN